MDTGNIEIAIIGAPPEVAKVISIAIEMQLKQLGLRHIDNLITQEDNFALLPTAFNLLIATHPELKDDVITIKQSNEEM